MHPSALSIRVPRACAAACALLLFAGPARPAEPTPPAAAPATSPAAAAPAPSVAAGAASLTPEQTPAGQLVGTRCTSCHTIGDGDKVGPDLLGVTTRRTPEWIRGFLTSPTKTIDGGDPIANGLVKKFFGVRMPEQNLSPEQISSIIDFFKACTAKGGCKPVSSVARKGLDGTPDEIEQGRALFDGTAKLANGGPACVECHHVRGLPVGGGGSLGPDLTFAYAKLHDAGVDKAIGAAPLEQRVYAGKALEPEESFKLKAYFATLSKDGTREEGSSDLLHLGLLGAACVIGFLGVLGTVRGTRESEKHDA